MLRITTLVFVNILLWSCSKGQQGDEINSIVLRHTGLDLSPFAYTITKDSLRKDGLPSLAYWRDVTLQFDSMVFDSLKNTVRATEYFDALEIGENVFLRSTWELKAPNAKLGIWDVSVEDYWWQKRYDDLGVDLPNEFLSIHLDMNAQTVELTYRDSRDNLIH